MATKARRTRGCLRFAHYPVHKTLSEFDFDFQPSLNHKVIAELSTLRFVEEKRNVILLGPPGVGKTHLAIALGIAATEVGYRTYFTSPQIWSARSSQRISRASLDIACAPIPGPRFWSSNSVLVIDELGYLPLDQASANWIFEVVSRRYEKASIVLTSNRGFSDWGQVFADSVVATAIVDRLLHSATLVNMRGRSYRMRAHQDAVEAKTADDDSLSKNRHATTPEGARNKGAEGYTGPAAAGTKLRRWASKRSPAA